MGMLERTPVTEEGLRQYDNLDPVVAVVKAWANAGRVPTWHHRMQNIVRKNMPVLGRALDRLAEDPKYRQES